MIGRHVTEALSGCEVHAATLKRLIRNQRQDYVRNVPVASLSLSAPLPNAFLQPFRPVSHHITLFTITIGLDRDRLGRWYIYKTGLLPCKMPFQEFANISRLSCNNSDSERHNCSHQIFQPRHVLPPTTLYKSKLGFKLR